MTDVSKEAFKAELDDSQAIRAIEAVLLVTTEPMPELLIAELVEIPLKRVRQLCEHIRDELQERGAGYELAAIAGGWRYQTCKDMAPYMERFALSGHTAKVSAAALETLSIIAYKQPVSRVQMSAIRGVNVDGVLKTLLQRGYVAEVGEDSGPGRATLYGTTSFFLESVGLSSIDQLPSLGDFVPSAEVLEVLENALRVEGASAARESAKNGMLMPDESDEVIDLTDPEPVIDLVEESVGNVDNA